MEWMNTEIGQALRQNKFPLNVSKVYFCDNAKFPANDNSYVMKNFEVSLRLQSASGICEDHIDGQNCIQTPRYEVFIGRRQPPKYDIFQLQSSRVSNIERLGIDSAGIFLGDRLFGSSAGTGGKIQAMLPDIDHCRRK